MMGIIFLLGIVFLGWLAGYWEDLKESRFSQHLEKGYQRIFNKKRRINNSSQQEVIKTEEGVGSKNSFKTDTSNNTLVCTGSESTENKQEQQNRSDMKDGQDDVSKQTYKKLWDALVEMGCQPEKLECETDISLRFQGEHFIFAVNRCFIMIWDPHWEVIAQPDRPVILEAINKTNLNFGPTVIYSDYPDGSIRIHSRWDVLLPLEFPTEEIVNYLRSVLGLFFKVKYSYFHELNKAAQTDQDQRTQEDELRKMGFDL